MKPRLVFALFSSCLLLALPSGCGSKADVNSQLQKAAAVMAQPEATPPPAPSAPEQAAQPAPTAAQPAQTQAQEMNQAMVAYKAGNLDDAVARLQKLRAAPVMSAEKRMALNDAMAAVMSEIYALAEKGDARAIQAVKLYEQLQTQRK